MKDKYYGQKFLIVQDSFTLIEFFCNSLIIISLIIIQATEHKTALVSLPSRKCQKKTKTPLLNISTKINLFFKANDERLKKSNILRQDHVITLIPNVSTKTHVILKSTEGVVFHHLGEIPLVTISLHKYQLFNFCHHNTYQKELAQIHPYGRDKH